MEDCDQHNSPDLSFAACFVFKTIATHDLTLSLYTDALCMVIISGSKGRGVMATGTYFEFIGVIEADLYGRYHP